LGIICVGLFSQALGQTEEQGWLAISDKIQFQTNEVAGEKKESTTLDTFHLRYAQLSQDLEQEVKTLKGLLHEAYLVQIEKAEAGSAEELAWKSLQEEMQATEQRIDQLQMSISDHELTYFFMMQEIEALEELSEIEE
ncbi:MAG: hypothetical protein AAF399_04415, partial [Bacteroidota bacterium]